MVDLITAIKILKEKFPDKKTIGNPAEYNGAYAFSMVSNDHVDGTPNWDSTITMVDKKTGAVSQFNAFEKLDFFTDARPIEEKL